MADDKRTITASQRADISRKATQRAFVREILMAAVIAHVWPSYLTEPRSPNLEYPALLCVDSPAGKLVWRVALDELPIFDWLEHHTRESEEAADRIPVLQLLAEGW